MSKPEADLFVLPTDALGGAERVMSMLVRETAAAGRNAHVVILSRGDRKNWKDVPPGVTMHYVRARSEKTGLLPALCKINSLSRSLNIRHAYSTHTHINGFLGVLRGLRLLKCSRLVARESTSMLDRFTSAKLASIRLLYRLGYGRQDLVICQTEYMRKRLVDLVPRAARWRLVVLPNPVDAARARKLAAEPRGEDLAAMAPYVVTVGRLVLVKGVDILISAFRKIRDRFPGLRLVIIGDGPLRATLQSQVTAEGLAGEVVFLGHLENPYPVLAGATLAVVSSRVEGFPNTLLEAMSVCGRVVSTRCAGGVQTLPGIHTCPPGDADALALCMAEALASEPALEAMRGEITTRAPASFLKRIHSALDFPPGHEGIAG